MSTATMNIARERQLEWLLDEVLGLREARATQKPRTPHKKAPAIATHWLAASIALLAIGTAIGVSILNNAKHDVPVHNNNQNPQLDSIPDKPIQWHECHGPTALTNVPADVVNLHCFDFNDQAMAQLAQFEQLERLNLSGMDINEKGYSISIDITDAGVTHLAGLSKLRWLSLYQCGRITGSTLAELRSIPQLEHLNVSSTSINSEAIATLAQLPSLRELSLTFCMDFHGRSLQDIARIPGLRRLELSYCPTISAKDAMHLTKLNELRYLDLSICCGTFLGQTADIFGGATNVEQPPPPKQDGIGITDGVVAALSALPLETLKIGGCHSLTDGIADSLAKMSSLHTLDLQNLPKTTGAVLANLPTDLHSLTIHDNHKYSANSLRALTRLTKLTDLGMSGLSNLDDAGLKTILAGKQLKRLALGGMREGMGRPSDKIRCPNLTPACRATLAEQLDLERLDLTMVPWIDTATMRELARLPRFKEIELKYTEVTPEALAALANSSSLRTVSLQSCRTLEIGALQALKPARLTSLTVYATRFAEQAVREVAKSWPGCVVVLPNARSYRVQD